MKTKKEKVKESFGEMCIRTGYKPQAAQGIDFSKYGYNPDGTVFKRLEVIPFGSGGDGNLRDIFVMNTILNDVWNFIDQSISQAYQEGYKNGTQENIQTSKAVESERKRIFKIVEKMGYGKKGEKHPVTKELYDLSNNKKEEME